MEKIEAIPAATENIVVAGATDTPKAEADDTYDEAAEDKLDQAEEQLEKLDGEMPTANTI